MNDPLLTIGRAAIIVCALAVIVLVLAGCASDRVYEGRDGNDWYRCQLRSGEPAWCRVE